MTRHTDWLEAHLDFLSLQANLFTAKTVTFWAQIRMLVHNQRRLADE